MRQTLVEKNLMGIYSDEIYQEQEKVIGNQITIAETVLGQTIFDKYTISDIEAFMKEKFSDVGKTYQKSNPGERRVLLGSIAPSGLTWDYSGLSNRGISKEYQSILSITNSDLVLSSPYRIRTDDLFLEKETS